jgi:hypothetical protein
MAEVPPPPSSDARARARCPICSGPTFTAAPTDTAAGKGRERCRNSLCVYNHRDAKCPRCSCQDLRSAWFAAGVYHYSCGRCQNSWQTPA